MKIAVDYVDQKIGYLHVKRHLGLVHHENSWLCQCICGKECVKTSGNLKRSKKNSRFQASCGCNPDRKNEAFESKIGKRFYSLTIIGLGKVKTYKYAGNIVQKQYVQTRCECGVVSEKSFNAIRDGRIVSCGCYLEKMRKAGTQKKSPGESGAYTAYQNVINRSKYKILQSDLSFEDFKILSQMPCHYCGIDPSNTISKGKHSEYRYSGLDRVDSHLGYTLKNLVPCCRDCNSAKGTKTVEKFKEWIARVYGKTHAS